MRKLAFAHKQDIVKVMACHGPRGLHLLLYNTWLDAPASQSILYDTFEDIEEACWVDYDIRPRHWVDLRYAMEGCLQDFIAPVRAATQDGHTAYERLESNGRWTLLEIISAPLITSTTVSERLQLSGLAHEFEDAMRHKDHAKAHNILTALRCDLLTISSILDKASSAVV